MKQNEALDIIKTGANVFLTGPAGSGKTFLLAKYIEYLRENNIAAAVTASTGIAATHLGGRTVHSWCGMGIEDELAPEKINALKKKEYLVRSVAFTKVLIIDEISMLSAKQLDLVDRICKIFKEDMRPFGGMQVIFCGDFFQLPPVSRAEKNTRFVTESHIWNNMELRICYLEEQHRQSDRKFLKLLHDMREGAVTEETHKLLKKRLNKTVRSKIKPTKLYTHNIDVESYNLRELGKIKGEESVYEMEGEGVGNLVENLKKGYCLAPQLLGIKIGALVMFVKNNFSKGYVNGTLGKVIAFDEDDGYPVVETADGSQIVATPEQWVVEDGREIIASVRQVPLRLAWAITVHKSQGMSLDAAEMDLSKTFEYGMGYVALSRVRSLAGMYLLGMNDMALCVRKEAIESDKLLQSMSEEEAKAYRKLAKSEVAKAQRKFLENNGGEKYAGGLFG